MNLTVLILVLLAIAFLLQIDFVYYIVYVCLGVYAFSRWYAPRALRQLRVQRHYSDHAFLGETVPVQLEWENRSRLPLPWIEFSESVPPVLRVGEHLQQVLSLGGRQKRAVTYEVYAGRRGYYQLGPTRLATGDLFGLVAPTTGYLKADTLTVYPRIIPLARLGIPSRLPFGTLASQQRLFEDPARPAGVRDYSPGDSQRTINWKVSAHADRLVVRRYQPAISLATAVLLDMHSADYERRDQRFHTEWAIVIAASLAAHLVEQRQPVGLITNGIDPLRVDGETADLQFHEDSGRLMRRAIPAGSAAAHMSPAILPRNGRAHLMKILERLARLESEMTVPFPQWVTTACLHLSWGTTLLAITARGDLATCEALHRLVRTGFNPILIAVEPDYNFGEVRQRARRLGFRAFHVTEASGMELWRTASAEVAL